MMRWVGEVEGVGSRKAGRGAAVVLGWRSPLVRAALGALLEQLGYRVVAEAGDWPALVAVETKAVLAIVDIALVPASAPGSIGLPLVVIAPTADHAGIAGVIGGGAAGLVLGSESTDALRLCLASVAAGGQWFDRTAVAEATERRESQKEALLLTRRERDVARLVATGQRNRAIAGSLGISEGTVKMHLHNVYSKLGLESRTQLAMDERLRMDA